MEKKIKFNDVVEFVKRAISNKNCCVILYIDSICIHKKTDDNKFSSFDIVWCENTNNLEIHLDKFVLGTNDYVIEITEPKEILTWKMLIEEAKDSVFKTIEYKFNNFFKEENKVTDINDLYSDDD